MATRCRCGKPEANEERAIEVLGASFGDDWALLTNIPSYAAGREIDACLIGPRGIVILELKYYTGKIRVPFIGPWDGINVEKDETPLEQAENSARIFKKTLVKKDPTIRAWVDFVVIMTNPNCELEVHPQLQSQFRVGLLQDALSLVNARLAQGSARDIGAETLVSIFKIITGDPPPSELSNRWHIGTTKPDTQQSLSQTNNGEEPIAYTTRPTASDRGRSGTPHPAFVGKAFPEGGTSSHNAGTPNRQFYEAHNDSRPIGLPRLLTLGSLIAFIGLISINQLPVRFVGTGADKSEVSLPTAPVTKQRRPLPMLEYDGKTRSSLQYGKLFVIVDSASGDTPGSRFALATGHYEDRAVFSIRADNNGPSPPRLKLQLMHINPSTDMPQVILTYSTGGAHCCTRTEIATLDLANKWSTIDGGLLDGDGYEFLELDNSGGRLLVSFDNSFLYAFGCYACSSAPTRIKKLLGAQLIDVTNDPTYLPFLRARVQQMEARSRSNGTTQRNAYLGGWVAAKSLVGEFDDAWRTMLITYDRASGDLVECLVPIEPSSFQCPKNATAHLDFPEALAKHLVKHGYITAPQAARLPGLPTVARPKEVLPERASAPRAKFP